jgi:CheY-like chemotaxis protein
VHPLVKGALVAAALSLAGLAVARPRPTAPAPSAQAASASSEVAPIALTELPCPERHLPEGRACVPLPELGDLTGAPAGAQLERRSRGALFEVIPRRPDRPADPAVFVYPIADEPLFLRGLKILVIEDEPHIVLGLTDALEFEGFAVISASRGKDGVQLARQQKPDAILLDLMLPDTNGFKVCEELRKLGRVRAHLDAHGALARRSTRSAGSTPAPTTT